MMWEDTYQSTDSSPILGTRRSSRSRINQWKIVPCIALCASVVIIYLLLAQGMVTTTMEEIRLDVGEAPNAVYVDLGRKNGLTVTNDYSMFVVNPLPDPEQNFPETFSWNNYKGYDLTTANQNEHQPNNWCGSCWAFAAAHVIDDRMNTMAGDIKRFTGTTWLTSIQVLLTCGPYPESGCEGGSTNAAFEWIFQHGIPDSTCHSYEAKNGVCNDLTYCQTCHPNGECVPRKRGTFPLATVSEYGRIIPQGQLFVKWFRDDMVKRMKAEITRGPIACSIHAGPIFNYFPIYPPNPKDAPYKPFIWTDQNGKIDCVSPDAETCANHVVSIVGWGQEKGVEYWVVRNSWGNYWGEHGWFRVQTGTNVLLIESGCDWAIPHVIDDQKSILNWVERDEPAHRDMPKRMTKKF